MMLLAILGAAIGLLEFRNSLRVWACHLPFQVAVFAMLITLPFARPCWPETCLCGGAFTFRHGVLPLRVPSFAPICGGLRGRTISTEPYYELPLPLTKLRSIFHFRVGAHSLPVEQGRIEMPKVPRHLRRCKFCASSAIGDERHCVFDCPHFQSLRQRHAMIFRDSHDAMRSVMWHKDEVCLCSCVGHCQ